MQISPHSKFWWKQTDDKEWTLCNDPFKQRVTVNPYYVSERERWRTPKRRCPLQHWSGNSGLGRINRNLGVNISFTQHKRKWMVASLRRIAMKWAANNTFKSDGTRHYTTSCRSVGQTVDKSFPVYFLNHFIPTAKITHETKYSGTPPHRSHFDTKNVNLML